VSIRLSGATTLGTRVEIKNMNSFRAVKDAIDHEIERQIELVEGGGRVVQETRLWNEAQGTTAPMRSKEEAHDYRYFPDPDLVPLNLTSDWLEEIRKTLPELPEARRARLVKDLLLSEYDAGVLVSEKVLVDFFEDGLKPYSTDKRAPLAKPLANWIITELLGRLNAEKKSVQESPLTAAHLAELVELINAGTINGKMAKDIFAEIYASPESPKAVVQKKGLSQVSDEGELIKLIDEVIKENAKIVEDVKGGKEAAIGSLVGALMKKTKGRANPKLANELIKKRILG
jgi:aspartyl-tRNA(Asn)/glutamyl-tRNA(Gln) amidotransferase subunit B